MIIALRRGALVVGSVLLVAGSVNAVAVALPPPVAVTKISAVSGRSVGDQTVTVTGSGFTGVHAVDFGSTAGTALHVVSPTTLTVRTPAHKAGAVDVRVLTSAGATSPEVAADRFTFTAVKVVLDPGHNGGNFTHLAEIAKLVDAGYGKTKPCNTTGTATDSGYREANFNWDVANRVRTILIRNGVTVIMTRSSNTGVGPCVNVRAKIESTKGVAAAVAIHADGAPSSGHGFHVNEDSRTPVGASRATVADSTRLGIALHDALARSSGLVPSTYIGTNGYVRRDDLAGLNLSTNPTSFLELGNMRNAGDAAKQESAAGRERIAEAIAAGILAYLRA